MRCRKLAGMTLSMTEAQFVAHQRRVKGARRKEQEPSAPKQAPNYVQPDKVSSEAVLGAQLRALGIDCQVDVHYLPGFKYRADVLIGKLVVEVQGEVHRIKGKFQRDIIKAQRTILGGFTLLPVSPQQVTDGSAADLVQTVLRLMS